MGRHTWDLPRPSVLQVYTLTVRCVRECLPSVLWTYSVSETYTTRGRTSREGERRSSTDRRIGHSTSPWRGGNLITDRRVVRRNTGDVNLGGTDVEFDHGCTNEGYAGENDLAIERLPSLSDIVGRLTGRDGVVPLAVAYPNWHSHTYKYVFYSLRRVCRCAGAVGGGDSGTCGGPRRSMSTWKNRWGSWVVKAPF